MRKRKPAFDPSNLLPGMGTPWPSPTDGMLNGLDREIASAVAFILRESATPRLVVAAELSLLTGEKVTKAMLDAYSSERRDTFNISCARFLALVALTRRYDVLASVLRRIGATAVAGPEAVMLEIGQVEMDMARERRRKGHLNRLYADLKGGEA